MQCNITLTKSSVFVYVLHWRQYLIHKSHTRLPWYKSLRQTNLNIHKYVRRNHVQARQVRVILSGFTISSAFIFLYFPQAQIKTNQKNGIKLKHFGKRMRTIYYFFCKSTVKCQKTRKCIFSPGTLSLLLASNNSSSYAVFKPPLLISIKNFIYTTHLLFPRHLFKITLIKMIFLFSLLSEVLQSTKDC